MKKMSTVIKNKKTKSSKFNSVQLNLVTFVDVEKADYTNTLDNCVYMIDNNPNSSNQGTNALQSTCKQGQVLNWIIYAMNSTKRPDGTWPPSVRINNIVFTNQDGTDVADFKVCDDLKLIGGPDQIRSKYTPVYFYWAGVVIDNLPEGVYNYRFVLELDTKDPSFPTGKKYLNLNTPSLKVLSV
jgi:hypothetical protein